MKLYTSRGRGAGFFVNVLLLLCKESLGWLNQVSDAKIKSCRCHSCSFTSSVHTIAMHVETFSEMRIRNFWESHPFEMAESILSRVLTTGSTSSADRLLHPVSRSCNDDYSDEKLFSQFYTRQPFISKTQHSSDLVEKNTKRLSFQLKLAYAGQHFCGWQRQPNNGGLPSIQAVVEDAVERAFCCNGNDARPDLRVSGRTDSGVHAVGQIARLRIHRVSTSNLTADELFNVLETASEMSNYTWRCLSVTAASNTFHPTFDSKSRSYVYLIDADALSEICPFYAHPDRLLARLSDESEDRFLRDMVERLDTLLQTLEGKHFDFFSFSYGKVKTQTTLCFLHRARARLMEDDESRRVLSIELTGDRFLRRMVRILVSTALEFAVTRAAEDENDPASFSDRHLIEICDSRDRQRTAKAAPPGGLIFAGAVLDSR